jgi:pSer/pThr/pTyr-binding forkhead associated (FHA) protein
MASSALHSAVSLSGIKVAGITGASLNVAAQNLLQCSAMIAAHRVSEFWGMTDASKESLGQEWAEAMATVAQIWMGITIFHGLTPSLTQRERVENLSIDSLKASFPLMGEGWESALSPSAVILGPNGLSKGKGDIAIAAATVNGRRPFLKNEMFNGINEGSKGSPVLPSIDSSHGKAEEVPTFSKLAAELGVTVSPNEEAQSTQKALRNKVKNLITKDTMISSLPSADLDILRIFVSGRRKVDEAKLIFSLQELIRVGREKNLIASPITLPPSEPPPPIQPVTPTKPSELEAALAAQAQAEKGAADLIAEMTQKNKALEEAHTELASSRNRVAELEAEHQRALAAIEVNNEEKIKNLETKKQDELAKLERARTNATEEAARKHRELIQARGRVTELEAELIASNKKDAASQEALGKLRSENEAAEQRNRELAAELLALQAKRQELNELRDEHNSLSFEFAQANEKIEELNARIAQLQNQLAQSQIIPQDQVRLTQGTRVTLNKDQPAVIGRSPTSHILISNEVVSRNHFKIRWNQDHWSILDLESHYGTQFNGHKLDTGVWYILQDQTLISLGVGKEDLRLLFRTKPDGTEATLSYLSEKEIRKLASKTSKPTGETITDPIQPIVLEEVQSASENAIRAEIDAGQSISELIEIFRKSSFQEFDGLPRSWTLEILEKLEKGEGSIQDLPRVLRQKIRDLKEAEMHHFNASGAIAASSISDPQARKILSDLAEERLSLDNKIFQNFLGIQRRKIKGRGKTYNQKEMKELLYEVLERGKSLEQITAEKGIRDHVKNYMQKVCEAAEKLYPEEWRRTGNRNYFTGERFGDLGDKDKPLSYLQTRYRFARMLLNTKLGQSIFGEPTQKEKNTLTQFITHQLHIQEVKEYGKTQAILRDHFSRFSPELKEALHQADPETRALVIETFFGIHQHRQLNNPYLAFEIARFLGSIGFYREVGVTLEFEGDRTYTNISLGDLSSVSPETRGIYFVLHTHPEIYINQQGERMGQENGIFISEEPATIVLDEAVRSSRSTTNVLFSHVDVRLFVSHASSIFRHAQNNKNLDLSIFYDRDLLIFKNWVQHPYGISEIQIQLNKKGKPIEVTIQYGIDPDSHNLDNRHEIQAKELRKMSKELGIPVKVFQVDHSKILKGVPYADRQ